MKQFFCVAFTLLAFCNPMIFAQNPPNYGAINASNSCFMNAATQALFHIQPLRDYIENNSTLYLKTDEQQAETTTKKFIDHLDALEKNKLTKKAIDPRAFRNSFPHQGIDPISEISSMKGYHQHDAQEFFSYILDRFTIEIISNNKAIKEAIDKIFLKADKDLFRKVWDKIENDTHPPLLYTQETLRKTLQKKIDELILENFRSKLYQELKQDKNKKIVPSNVIQIIEDIKNKHLQMGLTDHTTFDTALTIKDELKNEAYFANFLGFLQAIRDLGLPLRERNKLLLEQIQTADLLKTKEVSALIEKHNTHDKKNGLINLYNKLAYLGEKKKKIIDDKLFARLLLLINNDLSSLSNALNNALKNQRSFKAIFESKLKTTLIHDGTHHRSEKEETGWMLQLDIAKYGDHYIRLQSVISDYFKEEKNISWTCSVCKQSIQATKRLQIKTLPKILTMQFKRFLVGPSIAEKFQTPIIIDQYLHLKPPVSEKSKYYKLFAMIMHGGGANAAGQTSGHYWTYARWKNNWFKYNDDIVTHQPLDNINTIIKQTHEKGNPYLVLYEHAKNQEQAKTQYEKQEALWQDAFKAAEARRAREAEEEKKRLAQLMPNLKKSLINLKAKLLSVNTIFDTLTKKKAIATK